MSTYKNLRAILTRIACVTSLSILASQANAVIVDTIGDSFTIDFNGIIEGTPQPGLSSTATFLLTDITDDGMGGQNWVFSGSLSNTSSAPITSSRVTVLGFNITQDFDGDDSFTKGLFNTIATGTMPYGGDFDMCLKKDGTGKNCAGGADLGVLEGQTLNFKLSLNVDSLLPELELTDFTVRYQTIVGAPNVHGGYGVASPSPVPVPAAAWLMGSALLGLGGMARRRNK